MKKFCQFVDARARTVLHVNSREVRCVTPDPDGGGAIICFDQDHMVAVTETTDNVVKAIENASWS